MRSGDMSVSAGALLAVGGGDASELAGVGVRVTGLHGAGIGAEGGGDVISVREARSGCSAFAVCALLSEEPMANELVWSDMGAAGTDVPEGDCVPIVDVCPR